MPNGTPGQTTPPLPGWLGPIVSVTTQVGVPTVFAGVLLWFVLFKVGAMLDATQRAEEDRVRIVAAMQDSLVGALESNAQTIERAIQANIAANRELAARYDRPPPTTQRHEDPGR